MFFITQITVHYVSDHIFGFVSDLLMEVLGDLLIFVFAGDECKLPLAHLALLGLCSGAICDDLVDLLVVQVTRHRKISVHLG